MKENSPILIGVGQARERVPNTLTQASSHADLAGQAARRALKDAGLSGDQITSIACVRTFSDSTPLYASPFGGPNKFPLAVAQRIGATPKRAIYDVLGGQSPQTLVAETAQYLMEHPDATALICGGEAIANMKAAKRAGMDLDWSETYDGEIEDRGPFQGDMIMSPMGLSHGLMDAMSYYGFIETARRIKAGRTLKQHQNYMAELIAPMSSIASANPYSMFRGAYAPDEIAKQSDENRPLTTPYSKYMVAKDGVNQGAAVLMTTVRRARELGISEDKWVHLRGHSEASEKRLLERIEIGHSLTLDCVIDALLDVAKLEPTDIDHADIYSCFPCVVDQTAERLGRMDKSLTLTGGLPFFGGPGNNYTLHGICEVVQACRENPGSIGLAHGNGGWMSKQALGLYSTEYRAGDIFADRSEINKKIKNQASPGVTNKPEGEASIESYIVRHKRGIPFEAILIGRLETGPRFYAKLQDMDGPQLKHMAAGDYDQAKLRVEAGMPANKAWLI